MAEVKKLGFLMREVKQGLFAGLVRNPTKTIAKFVTEDRTIEKALAMRAEQYNLTFVGTANDDYVDSMRIPTDSLSETIR